MSIKYFAIHCSSFKHQGFLIWFCNSTEGVITANKRLLLFETIENLTVYLSNHQIDLEQEPSFHYDFKAIEIWTQQPRKEDVQSEVFLNVWNILTDIANSTDHTIESDKAETSHVYRKLFAANNLPSINRTGVLYKPHWSNKEIRILKEVLQAGIQLFNQNITIQS